MKKYNRECEYCGTTFVSDNSDKKYCSKTHQTKSREVRRKEVEKDKFADVDNTDDFNLVDEIFIVKHGEYCRVTTTSGTDTIGTYTMYSSELQFLDGVIVTMKPNGLLITGHYDIVDDVNEEICYVFNDGELIVGSSRSQIEDYLSGE